MKEEEWLVKTLDDTREDEKVLQREIEFLTKDTEELERYIKEYKSVIANRDEIIEKLTDKLKKLDITVEVHSLNEESHATLKMEGD